MNIFKGLLFLEGHIVQPHLFDDDFAPHYGNQRASQRTFRDSFAETEFGRTAQAEPCSAAGCG
jgi:hypothetical protein